MENGYRRGWNADGASSSGLGLRAGDWERGRGGGDWAGSVGARERSRSLDAREGQIREGDRGGTLGEQVRHPREGRGRVEAPGSDRELGWTRNWGGEQKPQRLRAPDTSPQRPAFPTLFHPDDLYKEGGGVEGRARAREPIGERFDPRRGDGARHHGAEHVRGGGWESERGLTWDDRGKGVRRPRDMARDEWQGGARHGPTPRFREDARADARSREGGGGGGGGGAEERRGAGQLHARQITGVIKNCRGLGELARILHEQRGVLNHIHVSAAWGCLVRIAAARGAGDVREALSSLEEWTRVVMGQAGGRELATVLNSMAKLHQLGEGGNRGLLEAMKRRATAMAGEFKPQDVANVLWALATMGER
ncbi:hypothetical protein T484DRAFT_1849529, partial [Baffinella frigidus]